MPSSSHQDSQAYKKALETQKESASGLYIQKTKSDIQRAHQETEKVFGKLIETASPMVVGAVAGWLSGDTPLVTKLASQITKKISAPLGQFLSFVLVNDKFRNLTDQPRAGMRKWLLESPDPAAKSLREFLAKASIEINNPHVNLLALATGEISPHTEIAFWQKVSSLCEGADKISLSSLISADSFKSALTPVMGAIFGEKGKTAEGQALIGHLADGLFDQLQSKPSATDEADKEPSSPHP